MAWHCVAYVSLYHCGICILCTICIHCGICILPIHLCSVPCSIGLGAGRVRTAWAGGEVPRTNRPLAIHIHTMPAAKPRPYFKTWLTHCYYHIIFLLDLILFTCEYLGSLSVSVMTQSCHLMSWIPFRPIRPEITPDVLPFVICLFVFLFVHLCVSLVCFPLSWFCWAGDNQLNCCVCSDFTSEQNWRKYSER